MQSPHLLRMRFSDASWKWLLLTLCGFGLLIVVMVGLDQFGIGARPWYGFLDAGVSTTSRPFVLAISGPNAGGATDKAGIRDGDTVDLREISLDTRIRELFQPLATTQIVRTVHRGNATLHLPFTGSTIWEGASQWKLGSLLPALIANTWFLACAILIAFRCFAMRDGRILALVLLSFIPSDLLGPANFAIPNAALSTALFLVSSGAFFATAALLISLASRFGKRSSLRTAIEISAYTVNAVNLASSIIPAIGIVTLALDPLPYLYSQFWHLVADLSGMMVLIASIASIASVEPFERPRATWLLLPLSLAYAISIIFASTTGLISDWYIYVAMQAGANISLLAGAAAVTYALLHRRVLDFGFIVNRAIVISAVTITAIAPFVAFEWFLSSHPSVSKDMLLVISAAVTLALGLCMPPLYQGISSTVERYLFAADYRARKQVTRLAAGLPYAESFEAIGATLTKAVCRALGLPSAVIYRRNESGAFERDISHGWLDSERLQVIDAQRLAMDLQGERGALRIADEFLELESLPAGDREPAVAFGIVARQSLVGYVLYSGHANGIDLDPNEMKLLNDVAREASRGWDAVELASRVEHAYLARLEAENEAKDTLRRSNATLERLNEAQARFMPNEFLQMLNKTSIVDVALGDSVQKHMTVLFSDIRSFTTISEGMTPAEIFAFLNRYLQRAEPIVTEHGGFIDKYIGDAVMGLFPTRSDDALSAGLDMLREVRVLNRKLTDEGKHPMQIGVGLHTGDLILGTIGGRNRMETTVIADAVNAASRLESATKTFGCSLVLSRETHQALADPARFMLRELGPIAVKGKSEELYVFEAFDADAAEQIGLKQSTLPLFNEGRLAFEAGDAAAARARFEEVLAANPQDGPARYYLSRC